MLQQERWLLPEGIREILADEALQIEKYRREILQLFYSSGYDLIHPPLVDYLDSLTTGTGKDLRQQTFALTDPLSGRLLGIRSDMTPQMCKIDAHYSSPNKTNRLCYFGEILHTHIDGFSQSRCPVQVGAEIFGHKGYQSDLEIIELLLKTFRLIQIDAITLDLGHIAIFRKLARNASLSVYDEEQLFAAFQAKSEFEIERLLQSYPIEKSQRDDFIYLTQLQGDISVLQMAKDYYQDIDIQQYIQELERLSGHIQTHHPEIHLFFDLSELRGFNYHSGIVFSAYKQSHGQAIAMGGRYDGIGEKYGSQRAATGFSIDITLLLSLSNNSLAANPHQLVYAPIMREDILENKEKKQALDDKVKQLREQGWRVINQLNIDISEENTTSRLEWLDGEWQIVDYIGN